VSAAITVPTVHERFLALFPSERSPYYGWVRAAVIGWQLQRLYTALPGHIVASAQSAPDWILFAITSPTF
jgi:hypothetical protein